MGSEVALKDGGGPGEGGSPVEAIPGRDSPQRSKHTLKEGGAGCASVPLGFFTRQPRLGDFCTAEMLCAQLGDEEPTMKAPTDLFLTEGLQLRPHLEEGRAAP